MADLAPRSTDAALNLPFAGALEPHSPSPPAHPPEEESRIESLLRRLPLERKIDLLGGEDWMYSRAAAEIGLPRLKMADGPLGVRNWGPATAYAGGIALAATWDLKLAAAMGTSLGRDCRARGVHILLAPGVNIHRAPLNGRNFEYFGEDPFLAARFAVSLIRGIQSQGVVATVKHYAGNNAEYDRHNADSVIDERTLREIYLPAFEAAVKEADVGAVMNAYNPVNGLHATQNAPLNIDILKGEWGFPGLLMSDWESTYDAAAAANAGLDLEMPEGKFLNRRALLPLVREGQVTEACIDDKVRRLVRIAVRFGFLDRPQQVPEISLYDAHARDAALASARQSAVLLKNDGPLLPLDPGSVRTLAVLGPNAHPAVPGGGGSAQVTPFSATSLLTGLGDALAGKVRVTYARGLKPLPEIFASTRWSIDPDARQPGLRCESLDANGAAISSETVGCIDFWRPGRAPKGIGRPRDLRFSGFFHPRRSGWHAVLVAGSDQDSYRVTVNGKVVLTQGKISAEGRQIPQHFRIELPAGVPVEIALEYTPTTTVPTIGLGLIAIEEVVEPDALRLAANADLIAVAIGFDASSEAEACDRTYELPFGQDELVCRAADANARTVVVLNAGGSVDVRKWLHQVPVLLHAFYGGQESGRALAEIITGECNPSGRLPISFERKWEDNPSFPYYYPSGRSKTVRYREGLSLGYRHFVQGNKALYPFGYGLSYTRFHYSNLAIQRVSADAIMVSFDLGNVGGRAGAEIAQLYVGAEPGPLNRPERELKGFARIHLQPGEVRRVELTLDRRAFAYWDTGLHRWNVPPGIHWLQVGRSSDDIILRARVVLEAPAEAAATDAAQNSVPAQIDG